MIKHLTNGLSSLSLSNRSIMSGRVAAADGGALAACPLMPARRPRAALLCSPGSSPCAVTAVVRVA